jgi:hypothetical protein
MHDQCRYCYLLQKTADIDIVHSRPDAHRFRQIFTSLFIPGGTAEQIKWFDDLQRLTTSAENAAGFFCPQPKRINVRVASAFAISSAEPRMHRPARVPTIQH